MGFDLPLLNRRYRTARDRYAAGGFNPDLVLDFEQEYYRVDGAQTSFDDALNATRSDNATMADSDGLLKWAPHNLVRYSQQFDDAAWNKGSGGTGAAPIVTANAGIAPDGTETAARLQCDLQGGTTSSDRSWITQANSAGYTVRGRVWLKSYDGAEYTVVVSVSGVRVNAVVTNEWQLFSTSGLVAANPDIRIGLRGFSGISDTCDILVWGAHVYRSDLGGMVDNPDTGNSYVPTTSAARYLLRRGHHIYDGSQWVKAGILLEASATSNLVQYSEDFTDTSWGTLGLSTTSNTTTAPDGNTTADKLVEDASNGRHDNVESFSTTPSAVYTCSVYLKAAGRSWAKVRFDAGGSFDGAFFNLSTGEIGTVDAGYSALIEDMSNGWYRCSVSAAAPSSTTFIGVRLADADGSDSYTGDSTSGVYAWGAQLELEPVATSYIPTSGAAASRSADSLQVDSPNLPWSAAVSVQTEGFFSYVVDQAPALVYPFYWAANTQNRIFVYIDMRSLVGGGRAFIVQEEDNVVDAVSTGPGYFSPGVNVPYNIASRHGATVINAAVDGVIDTANTTPTALPDLSSSPFRLDYANNNPVIIKKLRMWDTDIGDFGIGKASV